MNIRIARRSDNGWLLGKTYQSLDRSGQRLVSASSHLWISHGNLPWRSHRRIVQSGWGVSSQSRAG